MNFNNKGLTLFWENYNRAFDWCNSSNVSHWKARVRALEVENATLREFIQREIQSGSPCTATPSVFNANYYDSERINDEHHEELEELPSFLDQIESDSAEMEVDEDLLAFYEKTIRHKIERRKQQCLEQQKDSEDSLSDNEKIYSMGPITTTQKVKDMAILYGKDAPKILSMELSMQINFDMNCSKSNAQLWPNIPLRLS